LLNSEDNPRAQDSPNFDLASDIVELVVFTNDPVFMQTLREAVGGSRRLWHVPSADKVSDLLLAGQVGILVLDLQSHADAAGSFVAQIKDQFPDLVVVVAGNREAETSLAKLISDGTVYRFIHKPMSPGRARLFADAAVKKFEGRRKIAPPPPPARAAGRGADRRRVAVSLALGVAVLAAGWIAMRMLGHDQSPAPAAPPAQAVSAPAMHETTAPGTPADPRERLLVQAENALLGNRLDEAATAIGAARAAGVDSGRISFLTSQLAALRERQTHASAAARTKGDARTAGTGTATAGVAAGASSAPADSDAAGAAGMAADEQPQAAGIVDAGALTLVRTTKPVYPARAETGKIEGWVELEFTVTERGEVRDIKVRAANPPGVFDRAAVGALSHWRYRPVLQGEQPVAQRARIRLRFTLAG
jgi:TonB family protein